MLPAEHQHASREDALEWYRIIEALRAGDIEQLQKLLTPSTTANPDVNKRSAQFGPLLNVAVALAPRAVVDWLLKHGASVNCAHPVSGETPLHIAAKTGRVDIVELLLQQPSIDDGARDAAGFRPKDVAKTDDIRSKIEAQQARFIATTTAKMHKYANATADDVQSPLDASTKFKELFSSPRVRSCVDINHRDPTTGATPLHEASRRGDADLVRWLLVDRQADPFIRDKKGKYFYEVTKDDKIKAVFKEVVPNTPIATSAPNQLPRMSGVLYKWTNYASGYKARWFTLEEGTLSYYKNQDDVPNSCRGSILLKIASLWIDVSDRHRFDIIGKGSIRYHLRAEHVAEAQRWIMAIKQSKTYLEDKMRREREGGASGGKYSKSLTSSASTSSHRAKQPSDASAALAVAQADIADPSVGLLSSTGSRADDGGLQASGSNINSRPPSISESSVLAEEEVEEVRPPHQELLHVTANSARTQLDLQRGLLDTMQQRLETHTDSAGSTTGWTTTMLELLQALTWSNRTIKGLFDDYANMCEEREVYWRRKFEVEHHRKDMWEESLAKLAEEYNTIEREAQTMAATLGRQPLKTRLPLPGSSTDQMAEPAANSHLNSNASLNSNTASTTGAPSSGPPPEFDENTLIRDDDGSDNDDDDDDDEFFDADEGSEQIAKSLCVASQSIITPSLAGYESPTYSFSAALRTSLPVDHALLRQETSLWSVLKTAIGKDLSRITLPVYFNEPISMLQRMCEDIEYSQLLDLAWSRPASEERLLLVAAFAMSNYSSTAGRAGKPFNPLLGETFEYVRKDRGFRYVSEQVSHHPPISACFCESDHYEFYGEVNIKNKFWGKSLEILPQGTMHAVLKLKHLDIAREHYSWKKVTTTVNNLIVGKLWIDHTGDMVITNHRTGERVVLTFKPAGWRSKNRAEIEGKLYNAHGEPTWDIWGRWDEKLCCKPIGAAASVQEFSVALNSNHPPAPVEEERGKGQTTLWRRFPVPVLTPSNFMLTPFALTLNQLPPELPRVLCPSDCRLRPDQRAMEDGDYDTASKEKNRLEEQQRAARKVRDGQGDEWTPKWFTLDQDADTNDTYWRFLGDYWKCREEQRWDKVPQIF
ncbi:hypothetical protein RI367_000482 [Sorochytrium milnesiophthora]